jgi:hypothetical protein
MSPSTACVLTLGMLAALAFTVPASFVLLRWGFARRPGGRRQ